MKEDLKQSVAKWLLENYQFFSELLEIAIFVHRRRSHLGYCCKYGRGDMSLDGQLKFNIICPVCEPDEDDMLSCLLVFNFALERHNPIWISHVDFKKEDAEVFGGDLVFDLLVDEDFLHFERDDWGDIPKAHKIIKERLTEMAK